MNDQGYRTQYLNRNYNTKYDNETYSFIKNLQPGVMLKETAQKIGVSYFALYNTFKVNRIPYPMSKKIETAFELSETQLEELKKLVAR